jgi:hypothetical protein
MTGSRINTKNGQVTPSHSPAMEADVNITVWNHIGKKYIMEKLQNATRKLLIPTRTGIFCFSRKGVRTGSATTFSSIKMNRRKNRMATTRVEMTRASSHYSTSENNHPERTDYTHRELFVVAITQEQ